MCAGPAPAAVRAGPPPAFRPARARVNVPFAPVPKQQPPSGLEPADPERAESPEGEHSGGGSRGGSWVLPATPKIDAGG